MIFLDGREFTGEPPGLRTVQRGQLMLVYLTDVRGEKPGQMLQMHHLHGYHGFMPPMALIALLANVAWSTSRSTPSIGLTGCQLQSVTIGEDGLTYRPGRLPDLVIADVSCQCSSDTCDSCISRNPAMTTV